MKTKRQLKTIYKFTDREMRCIMTALAIMENDSFSVRLYEEIEHSQNITENMIENIHQER